MQTILITGSSSSIVSQFINKIDKNKFRIKCIDIALPTEKIRGVEYYTGNICNKKFINEITKDVDIIIHFAAITHSVSPINYYKINTYGTINLVNAVKKNSNMKKFIFISTRTAELTCGHYGISKLKAEKFIIDNMNNYLIIRPAEIFGTSKKIGIEKLIDEAINKKFVFVPAGIKYKLFPVYVDDVIDIMIDLIFEKNEMNKRIIINGCAGWTYKELVQKISNELEKKIYIISIPKIFFIILKNILDYFNLGIAGIVSDQIPRLYGAKQSQNLDYKFTSILDYAKNIANKNKNVFETIADDYNRLRKEQYGFAGQPQYFDKIRADYINKYLDIYFPKINLNILEAGCGQSHINKFINKNHKIIGIDLSFKMLLKHTNKNRLLNSDIFNLPFQHNSIDIILLINTLHHLNRKKISMLFSEFKRIIRKDGIILICEHNPYNPVTQIIFKNCSFDKGCKLLSPSAIKKICIETKINYLKTDFILFFPENLKLFIGFERYLNKIPFGVQYISILQNAQ